MNLIIYGKMVFYKKFHGLCCNRTKKYIKQKMESVFKKNRKDSTMAIADDFSVAVNGDIRHVSGSTTYTVLQFHRFLQDLADDAQASGNDKDMLLGLIQKVASLGIGSQEAGALLS